MKESVNEVVFYLEEKNIVPEKYTDQDIESKGFYDPVIVQDFPLRGKKVFLNIRRRRWLLKKHNEYISCLLYTSPSPRDSTSSRMPSSA